MMTITKMVTMLVLTTINDDGNDVWLMAGTLNFD